MNRMVNEWEGRIRQAPGRRNNRCQLTKNFLPTQTLWIYQINDVSWNVKARWTQCLATLTVNNNNPEKIFKKNFFSFFVNAWIRYCEIIFQHNYFNLSTWRLWNKPDVDHGNSLHKHAWVTLLKIMRQLTKISFIAKYQ